MAAPMASVCSRLILTIVSLPPFVIISSRSITLNSIPMWPLGVSSASHSSNHCHWIALHSTGWHNTPMIRHEGHRLYTAAGPDKGRIIFCNFCIFFFYPTHLSLKGHFFFARLRFNKDRYLRTNKKKNLLKIDGCMF